MREKPKDRGRLLHILMAVGNIYEFIDGRSADDFHSDKLLYYAVVKNLEIIGEASYMLTPHFQESHPATEWKNMVRMRHILVHGYYQIDPRVVWETVINDLPVLESQVKEYLKEFDAE